MMANDTATLVLTGRGFPIVLYSSAIGEFGELINDLNADFAPQNKLAWFLSKADSSGDSEIVQQTIIATRAEYDTKPGQDAAEIVVDAYQRLGQSLEHGQSLDAFSSRVRKHAMHLRGMINGHIRTMVFQTAEGDAQIGHAEAGKPLLPHKRQVSPVSLGSVRGRIEMMGRRQGLRFTLYTYPDDLPVSCFISQDASDRMSEQLRGAWGRIAIVSGLLRRDIETDRPLTMRQVSAIRLVNERDGEWDYRSARGVWPWTAGDPTAADTIRMVRDG